MTAMQSSTGVDAGRLKSFIQRIEKLEEDRTGIGNDIKEVFADAKSAGYDVKIMKAVIRVRKMDKADRDEQDELLTLYLNAVGE